MEYKILKRDSRKIHKTDTRQTQDRQSQDTHTRHTQNMRTLLGKIMACLIMNGEIIWAGKNMADLSKTANFSASQTFS